MRFWLLTSTFYGNWLPGDPRGFVGRVQERRPGENGSERRREHDKSGEIYDADLAGLRRHAQTLMKGEIILISVEQAETLERQFIETARYREWRLLAAAVMRDHVHWVVGLGDEHHGRDALQAFKAYGSRVLNQRWPRPTNGTWWTSKGSTRLLPDESAVQAAVNYVVRRQPNPLRVWIAPELGFSDLNTNSAD